MSRIRMLMSGLTVTILMRCLPGVPCLQAQVVDPRWSSPVRLSSMDGRVLDSSLVSDSQGILHCFWVEQRYAIDRDVLMYARFDGAIWSAPVPVHEEPPRSWGNLHAMDATIDTKDVLHIVWSSNWGPSYYARCPAANALKAEAWSPAITVDLPTYRSRLRVDSAGILHLFYCKFYGSRPGGVYYVRSGDGGKSWSETRWLDSDIPATYDVENLKFGIDTRDGLHAVWYYIDAAAGGLSGRWVRYANSFDGGRNWSPPVTIDRGTDQEPELVGYAYPGLALRDQSVHVVWSGGGEGNVGRRHRYSNDSGRTWSGISQILAGLNGSAGGDGLSFDSKGVLHFLGQIRYPQGLYHATWSDRAWSEAELIYLIAKDWQDPVGDRIHAHLIRMAITPQDQLVASFTTCGPCNDGSIYPNNRILFSMNERKPVLLFPHFADGAGYSMQFAVSNLSDSSVRGTVSFHDSSGQTVPVSLGTGSSQATLDLAPLATRVFTTAGTSNPLATGFVRVDLDKEVPLAAMSVFRFESGGEAGVLPAAPGRKFALYVERTAAFDAGVAALRLSARPIELKLYDSSGKLFGTRTWDFSGNHLARFVRELFEVPESFRGLLVMESEGDFAPLGLRFGDTVRTTIPITNLTALQDQKVFYFPQYADGESWSMLISASNLADVGSTGHMTFYDSSGLAQAIPTEQGSVSEIPLSLPAFSTKVITTTGASSPIKRGYVRVETNESLSTGLAVFRFGTGMEASVLPALAGRRFAIFSERGPNLETGVAVVRLSSEPVTFKIYDAQGMLAQSGTFPLAGKHDAKFVSELATLPGDFKGLLVLESAGDFAPVGLRFGHDVLSTIPATGF